LDIAKWKGYPTTRWYFYGLLMGPIALLALIGLPDLYQRKIQKSKLEMMDKILMAIQDLTVSKN
jgi:multisubunit Na+/H+ antiporter MnhG subunit